MQFTTDLVRFLCAHLYDGAILLCGDKLASLSQEIAHTTPITTRIIFNPQTIEVAKAHQHLQQNDIRIAVHYQDSIEFMNDIKKNQFDMIVLYGADRLSQQIAAAQQLLGTTGSILLVDSQVEDIDKDLIENYHCLELNSKNDDYDLTLLSPISMYAKSTQRRGARQRNRLERID